jgi:hypothetical protein
MEAWYSTRCKLTWKLKGTKYNRLYFQLAPSTLPTEGIGFGLLPTVQTADVNMDRFTTDGAKKRHDAGKFQTSLAVQAKVGLLPTPQAIDGNGTGRELRLKKDCNRDPNQPGSWRGDLKDYAIQGMLPTPTAMDSTNATAMMKSTQVKEGSMHSVTLIRAMSMGMLPTPNQRDEKGPTGLPGQYDLNQEHGKTSQLNPRFVLEMMGFPPNWTTLPFLSGETNQSRPLATQ